MAVRAITACTVLATMDFLIVELNGPERFAPGRIPSQAAFTDMPQPQPIRLLFWNQAGSQAGNIAPSILLRQPDLFLLANRHSSTSTHQLADAFNNTGPAHAAVSWPFDLFSRYPIERWATTSLNLPGQSRRADGSLHNDPGNAAWYQLRLPSGSLMTLWAIDLPSSPKTPRMQLVRQAAASIKAWNGTIHQLDGSHTNTYRTVAPDLQRPSGFPAPDLIIGDFNIPRHSHSLEAFLDAIGAPAMTNAFDQAGFGWQKTWPRTLPMWAIDQCFVGEHYAVASYETFDLGAGAHLGLQIECVETHTR